MNQEKGTAYAPQVGVNGHANGQGAWRSGPGCRTAICRCW